VEKLRFSYMPNIQFAIPIFESASPDCQGLFLFDNATSHSVYTKDALQASAMNLRPGEGQALLRPGINPLTSAIQSIVMPDS